MPTKAKPRKRKQPVSKGFKAYTDARKSKIDLLKDVQKHVVAKGIENADEGRESHKIHVSEVVKDTSCPRYLYYKITEAERSDIAKSVGHRLEMIWAAGHHEHAKWQKWLEEMGDLWGTWHCRRCDARYMALADPACEKCGYVGFLEYEEVELEDEEYLLVGHADGAVPRLNVLVEVKSFSVGTVRIEDPGLVKLHTHKANGKSLTDHYALWQAIKRPLKSHLKQGMFYLWMAKRMGLPYDKVIFIYENKTNQDTKAFEVKLSERFIRDEIEMLEEVMVFKAEGVTPARPSLFAKGSKPCNECPFVTGCWGDDDQDQESAPVPAGRQGARSEATGRGSEVRTSSASTRGRARRSGRRDRDDRRSPDQDDDSPDTVGRASRRATRNGRGGRAVGRRSEREGTGSRFSRQGARRNRAQGEGVRE